MSHVPGRWVGRREAGENWQEALEKRRGCQGSRHLLGKDEEGESCSWTRPLEGSLVRPASVCLGRQDRDQDHQGNVDPRAVAQHSLFPPSHSGLSSLETIRFSTPSSGFLSRSQGPCWNWASVEVGSWSQDPLWGLNQAAVPAWGCVVSSSPGLLWSDTWPSTQQRSFSDAAAADCWKALTREGSLDGRVSVAALASSASRCWWNS